MNIWKEIKNIFVKEISFVANSTREIFFNHKKSVLTFDFNFNNSNEVLDAYYNVPQLQAVINYLSNLFADGRPTVAETLKDDQEKIISDHWFTNLLAKPHPLYSEGEFLKTFAKQYYLFGAVIMVKIAPVGMAMEGLFILPFQDVQVKLKDKLKAEDIIYATNINQIVDKYLLNFKGSQVKFDPEEIYTLSTTSMKFDQDGYMVPDSPVTGIKQPLNNLLSQYKARNTIIDKRGALGILSNNDSSAAGSVPIKPEDKTELQDTYNKDHGLTGQDFQVIITNANLKWQSMTMAIKDLQLLEGISEDKVAVCDAYQFPVQLLNSLKASTLNNFQTADKIVYTKKIIPDNNIIAKSWTVEFLDSNETFYFDLSHVDVLKEDRETNVDISTKEIDIITGLNTSIATGDMTKNNAVSTLLVLTDINEVDANLMLKDDPEPIQIIESQVIEVEPTEAESNE